MALYLLSGLLSAVLLVSSVASSATAQAVASLPGERRLHGRVLKEGQGQAGVEILLHRVARDTAGVIATTTSGQGGEFRLQVPAVASDGFHVYFTTADYLGVRYFGPALHPTDPWEGYTVQVYDTATAQPTHRLRIARRDVVLLPDGERGWEINEVVQIRNEEERTLVAAIGVPTWELRLPEGAGACEVGEGEIAPADVFRMGERVLVSAPLPPGSRELFMRYRVASGAARLRLPVSYPTSLFQLFVRQPAPQVNVVGLTGGDPLALENESFLRFRGADLPAERSVLVEWTAAAGPAVDPRLAAVVLTLVLLTIAAGMAMTRRSAGGGSAEGRGSAMGRASERETVVSGSPQA